MEKKGGDYASEGDVLQNFKRVAEINKLLGINVHTPEGYALMMIILKIDRLANLLSSGKAPNNESLDDTLDDMKGYTFLLSCILKEKDDNKELLSQ